ncbi:adhesion G protein-coupled receptor E3 [Megalobrama amblycephala]|uniref:adhesion G protein-coupled receptor E3 n=1 Tax=Megalobrama amblycephala TaxID=75352 RepID=UPI002013F4EE|nr:adhesion G protein-coupled receptor E3 [Megalobrama amblycephala]
MKIILHLTALLLLIITSNIVVKKSQGNWYCSPLVNTSHCANASSYLDCGGHNYFCTAYSCSSQSAGCSCKIGPYNCSSDCNYVSPDVCNCNASSHSCYCLGDTTQSKLESLSAEGIMNLVEQIANMTSQMTPEVAENYLKVVDAAQIKVSNLASAEDKDTLVSYGNTYLNAFESLVSALVKPTETQNLQNISLNNTEVRVLVVGPNASVKEIPLIRTEEAHMDINLFEIAKKSPSKSAALTFISYKTMENLLKPNFLFNTTNDTIKTMMSTVISATLSNTTNTNLTIPVNFTFKHKFNPNGSLSCVYWNISEWIVDGCSVLETNSSYTVCSCVHLSTFALIMQSSRPPESDSLLEMLNLVCVIVGLVFFSLALLTFALCQWSPGVNNVARINICISLLLAHLLFLLTQQFLRLIRRHQVSCAVISGVLHFLFLSGFVWMFIEAVLLFICVKNLSQISSKKREVLSSGFLCVIGYTVALVVVAVSAGLVPEGYGSEHCWIKMDKGFIWSFLGPVCVILALNTILFICITIRLNSTLKNLNAEVSQMKQTKIMVFKTLAQFVVLGCSWILGFFTNGRRELEILFLILNSQQGTFIFLVYCVLNNEVRQQYRKFFRYLGYVFSVDANNTEDYKIMTRK